MSGREVTQRDALLRLGASTAEAIAQVLETFVAGGVERGEVTVMADGVTPFSSLPPGAIATSISYVDGVSGANVFVLAPAGARALAGAMGVAGPKPDADGHVAEALSELELSAVAEAANQAMAAAASAISLVIGQEVQIGPPDTRVLTGTAAAVDAYGTSPHAMSTTFLIAGESCRLIQLVPAAFVMRMARAIAELNEQVLAAGAGVDPGGSVGLEEALASVNLRVWAELGRTRLPLGQTLELPLGAVVDLDCAADDPVDLFVNGMHFADGHLLVDDNGEWAIVIDRLTARPSADEPAPAGPAEDKAAAEGPTPEPQVPQAPQAPQAQGAAH